MMWKLNLLAKCFCGMLVLALLGSGAACSEERTESTAQASAETSKPRTEKPAEASKPAAPPKQAAVAESGKPRDASSAAPSQGDWGEQEALVIEDDSARKAMAEDMIYATIRIKMEDMIDKRAALLKSGHHPSDVEVRQLEGSIMRARDLLMEAGEIVEDLVPPIVASSPRGE